jgi:hypothetical protein
VRRGKEEREDIKRKERKYWGREESGAIEG